MTSAPFEAEYISQKNAKEIQKEFPLAGETVLKSTYMVDSLDSMVNKDEAVKLVQQLKELQRKAGMHPRKWLSNSKRVLREIDMKGRAKQIDLSMDDLPSVKTSEWYGQLHQISFPLVQLPWLKT